MTTPQPLVFFTICSKNFLAYARTLCASVRESHPGARFYVALCDRLDGMVDPRAEPFDILELEALGIEALGEMIARYNITELNTAIKPFVFERLFDLGHTRVVYLDPDILVVSPLEDVERRLGVDVDAVLTPHVLHPAENVPTDDVKMLQYGIYNLGFVAFHGTPQVREIVRWWGRRLERECVIDLAQGLFVDQKWADLLPSYIPRTLILHHCGYNLAYWNILQRRVTRTAAGWRVNGDTPLVFAHFSGNDFARPEIFSRHSPRLSPDEVGEAMVLLAEYRERVFANGHAHYSTLPYAFDWNGASGRNEHTPRPASQAVVAPVAQAAPAPSAVPQLETRPEHPPAARLQPAVAPPAAGSAVLAAFTPVRHGRRLRDALVTLRRAQRHAGGWWPMLLRGLSVFRRGGLGLVRQTVRELNRRQHDGAPPTATPAPPPSAPGLPQRAMRSLGPSAGRRLLFIDWSTPRPDSDAGSITAYYLMKILVDLGYDVVFAPDDMRRAGRYTEALEAFGVTCLSVERDGPLLQHLQREGRGYDYALICRSPFAERWLEPIRKHAPAARVILNTSDLYFLRELRGAELSGSVEQMSEALERKARELDIIRRCDRTIVMSDRELQILREEAPEARVDLVPLLFVDIPGRSSGFETRGDILFIGGYLHRPNVDAVAWFCAEVWPLVRARLPDVRLHLIGSNPDAEIHALGHLPGVEVVGFVEDIAPWFDRIRLSIAPLRYGAGIKGKLGTSLSYGVPSVATGIAVEGMHLVDGEHVLVADDAQAFADAVVRLYGDAALWNRLSDAGLRFVDETYSVDAGLRRVGAFMREVEALPPRFPAARIGDAQDYARHVAEDPERHQQRHAHELSLLPPGRDTFHVEGWCAACLAPTRFRVGFAYAHEGSPMPNWREHLACERCGLNNRVRASVHALRDILGARPDADLYITEQATGLYAWLSARFPNLRGSEFFGDALPFGQERNGIRNEDMMAMTWDDASFDHVLSFDVLEHVPDVEAALRECHRVLRPGGSLLWTAPFRYEPGWRLADRNLVRATLGDDGELVHHLPPEYHANPVDPQGGALCFRHFGLEALEQMRAAGFADARLLLYWSPAFGHLGIEQVLCVARKAG